LLNSSFLTLIEFIIFFHLINYDNVYNYFYTSNVVCNYQSSLTLVGYIGLELG